MPRMFNRLKGISVFLVLGFFYLLFRFSSHAANAAVEDVTNKSSVTKLGQKYSIALNHIEKHIEQENGFRLSNSYLSGILKTASHIHAQRIAVIGISIIILLFLLLLAVSLLCNHFSVPYLG
jgi:hypothetical protein